MTLFEIKYHGEEFLVTFSNGKVERVQFYVGHMDGFKFDFVDTTSAMNDRAIEHFERVYDAYVVEGAYG